MNAHPLLKVGALSAFYGDTRILKDMTFDVATGEIVTILGANGAGKTTTLRALTGLVKTTGRIVFDGAALDGKPTEEIVRHGIAHVPDGRGTFTDLTVIENLMVGSYTRRDKAGVTRDLAHIFDYFPKLHERRQQQAGTLSGGEQQMLAIGRALMLKPRLLLLDEPSFGIAPMVAAEIFALLRTLNEEEKMTILLVEQNAAMALALSARAILLETGVIVRIDDAGTLAKDEAVQHAYLGTT